MGWVVWCLLALACQGLVGVDDEGEACPAGSDVHTPVDWYPDEDGDGYGDDAFPLSRCNALDGYVRDGGDCDDGRPKIYPGAPERCNDRDDDCDGEADGPGTEGWTTWYEDPDGDGYGLSDAKEKGCKPPDEGTWAEEGGDCDEDDPEMNPGCDELCDGVDNNCDGAVDDMSAVDASLWYRDADGDGYGSQYSLAISCECPEGWVAQGGDCDDDDPDTSPAAPEQCDGLDHNCDGVPDEGQNGRGEGCAAESCAVLLDEYPDSEDGEYWIHTPAGSAAVLAWCDMSSDGGGYTLLKVDYYAEEGSSAYATDAEAYCADLGMQLFVPRSEDHLVAAWEVATDKSVGPSATDDYLYIMGIYPDFNGARCRYTALKSGNASCQWSASDGGDFWVTDRTDFSEPNGDNSTDSSMYYNFGGSGAVTGYNDIRSPGYASNTFICQVGDVD